MSVSHAQKLDYMDYLAKFDHLFDIPKANKTQAYKRCV
jgi:hypothetical protein